MRRKSGGGPPALLAFLLATALVFGIYYIWQGFQTFMRTGGLGVEESTQRAVILSSATAERVTRIATSPVTLLPTATDVPACQEFRVSVPAGIVRDGPSPSAAIVTQFRQGESICVLEKAEGSEWYTIDLNPSTRRLELAYMHETIVEAANPTLTPSITPTASNTVTPPSTVTRVPTEVPTRTPTGLPSPTRDPRTPNTPLPTLTPSPTPSVTPPLFQSA
jgi:hypothetical protein